MSFLLHLSPFIFYSKKGVYTVNLSQYIANTSQMFISHVQLQYKTAQTLTLDQTESKHVYTFLFLLVSDLSITRLILSFLPVALPSSDNHDQLSLSLL